MIKRLFLGLLLAMLVPAAPAFAQATAEEAATNLQGLVGKEYEGGVKFAAVAAEDNVLVITLDGTEGWAGVTPAEITEIFLGVFCAGPQSAAFLKSNFLRIDMLDRGTNLTKGKPVNTCTEPEE